jgi:hypothetical protein
MNPVLKQVLEGKLCSTSFIIYLLTRTVADALSASNNSMAPGHLVAQVPGAEVGVAGDSAGSSSGADADAAPPSTGGGDTARSVGYSDDGFQAARRPRAPDRYLNSRRSWPPRSRSRTRGARTRAAAAAAAVARTGRLLL